MRIFVQFHETYLDLIVRICRSMKEQLGPEEVEFTGLALRRKTVCTKLDKIADALPVVSYDWLNDVESRILDKPHDPARLEHYRETIGDANLREMVSCGRQLGYGYVTGGIFPRTRLRKLLEQDPDLRWRYVVGLLDYFHDRFEKEKPAFAFFNEVTFPWEMAAYHAARHTGVSFVAMCFTRSGQNGYIAVDNPYEDCRSINRLFAASAGDTSAISPALVDQAAELLSSFRSHTITPEYTAELNRKMRRQTSLVGMFATLATDLMKYGATRLGLLGTRGMLRFENWLDVTRANWTSAIETRRALRSTRVFERAAGHRDTNYVYYPLHVEPEATTAILSSRMSNQLFFIEQISKSMPAGWKLLVKEHRPMLGRRPKGFYQRLKALPDVHLLSPFEDNLSLIKGARVVCVLAGTAGWEAIMMGIPAITVGNASYQGIDAGFIRCENLFDLGEYIQQAVRMEPVPDERIVRYIAATLQTQTSLTPRSVAYWHYGLKPDEAINQQGVEEMAASLIALYREKTGQAEKLSSSMR